jgi:hypothetical protein
MITHEKWFIAKHGQQPTFTASIRRQERHYGQPYPVRVGWFRRNLGFIIAALSGFGVVVAFSAIFLLSLHLLPNAIDVEMERQIAVVEQQINGGRR